MKRAIIKVIKQLLFDHFTEITGPEVKESKRNIQVAKVCLLLDQLLVK